MELRHTIRILNMPKNQAQMAEILRREGMQVYDDLRGIPPSDLTWLDDINGAGARTFIWNDRQRSAQERYNNITSFRGLPVVSPPPSFEEDVIDSRALVRLQQMYESGLLNNNDLREQARRILETEDRNTGREEMAQAVIRANSAPATGHNAVGWSAGGFVQPTTMYNTSVAWTVPGAITPYGAVQSNNSTEPPKIEIHERPPVRLVRLED